MKHCCSYNYNYSINKTKNKAKQIEKYKQIVNKSTNSKINISILTKTTIENVFHFIFLSMEFSHFFLSLVCINS